MFRMIKPCSASDDLNDFCTMIKSLLIITKFHEINDIKYPGVDKKILFSKHRDNSKKYFKIFRYISQVKRTSKLTFDVPKMPKVSKIQLIGNQNF